MVAMDVEYEFNKLIHLVNFFTLEVYVIMGQKGITYGHGSKKLA